MQRSCSAGCGFGIGIGWRMIIHKNPKDCFGCSGIVSYRLFSTTTVPVTIRSFVSVTKGVFGDRTLATIKEKLTVLNTGSSRSTSSVCGTGGVDGRIVGFIGMGNMGLPMAQNLLQRNGSNNKVKDNDSDSDSMYVIVHDVDREKCKLAQSYGLNVSNSIQEMIQSMIEHKQNHITIKNQPIPSIEKNVDIIIITMLPSCHAVDTVMNEIMDAFDSYNNNDDTSRLVIDDEGRNTTTTNSTGTPSGGGVVIIDCSTVNPSTSRKWNHIWNEKGCHYIDAPVSGGVSGAKAGTLTFMVGAPSSTSAAPATNEESNKELSNNHKNNNNNNSNNSNNSNISKNIHDPNHLGLLLATPYLRCMGKTIIPCGSPGAGSVTKLCNNIALAAQMIGICEAMILADTLGVNPVIVSDAMDVSTAKCWSNIINNPHPIVASARAVVAITKGIDGKSTSSGNSTGSPASKKYNGGFSTNLLIKDVSLALDAANEVGTNLPTTRFIKDMYNDMLLSNLKTLDDNIDNDDSCRSLGDKDFGVMFQYLQTKQQEEEK